MTYVLHFWASKSIWLESGDNRFCVFAYLTALLEGHFSILTYLTALLRGHFLYFGSGRMKIPAREREHQAASPGGGRVCGALIVFLLSVLAEDHKLTSIGDQSKADSADKPSADSGDQK